MSTQRLPNRQVGERIETAHLFYGINPERAATEHARRIGPLIAAPMGYRLEKEKPRYLSAEEARTAVSLLQSTPLFPPQTLVIGPVDMISEKVADSLLKSLEEYTLVVPVLYAYDLGGVRATIQSRVIARYSSGEEKHPDRTFFLQAAREGAWHDALALLKDVRGEEVPFLKSLAATLQAEIEVSPEDLDLCREWTQIRALLRAEIPLAWPDILQMTLRLKRGTSE